MEGANEQPVPSADANGSSHAADPADLERRLLAAHDAGDIAALSCLYRRAAREADAAGERDRAAFYLTHAWVFALEAGHDAAEGIHATLRSWGRAR